MARVETKTKSTRGQEIKCGKCGDPITPGMKYRSWGFRVGGRSNVKYYRCMKPACAPRQSELTQSRAGEMHALNERLEDACNTLRTADHPKYEDFKTDVTDIKEEADSLRDEFQGNFDNMPEGLQQGDTGQLLERRVEYLESFIDELDSAIDNTEWPEDGEEPNDPDPDGVEALLSDFESITLEVE